MKKYLRWIYYSLPRLLNSRHLFPCRNYVFEVTYRCNLDCRMCSFLREIEHKKNEITQRSELTSDKIADVVRSLPRHSNVAFTGGEPFVKKGFADILRVAKECGHNITLGTNGVLLDEEACKRIVDAGVRTVGLSLDGPKELHNEIRRSPGAFDGLRRAVETLRKIKTEQHVFHPNVMVNAVILPENYRLLPQVVALIKEWGADSASMEAMDGSYERSACRLQNAVDATVNPLANVPLIGDADFRNCLEQTVETAARLGIPLAISPQGMTIDDLVAYYRHQFDLSQWKCLMPWETCRISPYGDVYPCMNLRIGNIADKRLYELWSSNAYYSFRQLVRNGRVAPMCVGCCKLIRHVHST